jgi:hypothetical protein
MATKQLVDTGDQMALAHDEIRAIDLMGTAFQITNGSSHVDTIKPLFNLDPKLRLRFTCRDLSDNETYRLDIRYTAIGFEKKSASWPQRLRIRGTGMLSIGTKQILVRAVTIRNYAVVGPRSGFLTYRISPGADIWNRPIMWHVRDLGMPRWTISKVSIGQPWIANGTHDVRIFDNTTGSTGKTVLTISGGVGAGAVYGKIFTGSQQVAVIILMPAWATVGQVWLQQ